MSAFIVSDKTINSIVNWLRYDKDYPGHGNSYGYAAKAIEKLGFNLSHRESAEMLCHELYNLNYQAVNVRYEENNQHLATAFEFIPHGAPLRIQVYKSLSCLLYQCCEGDIPETSQLYKTLREVKHIIAENIVCDLSEYDKAKWDE